ncbi:MAG: ribbon-helix-helix protein, CopG family [Bryobacterales bacterium]|nr:ribbon-helix-helix protein, CopG family [Bryobacterales bacterium]
MIRTQIQLTENQAARLRAIAMERHQPVAELIRISIDSFLENEAVHGRESKRARAKSAAGRFASPPAVVSDEHDRYLAEAFGRQ